MFTKLGYGLFPKFTQDYGLFRPPNRASYLPALQKAADQSTFHATRNAIFVARRVGKRGIWSAACLATDLRYTCNSTCKLYMVVLCNPGFFVCRRILKRAFMEHCIESRLTTTIKSKRTQTFPTENVNSRKKLTISHHRSFLDSCDPWEVWLICVTFYFFEQLSKKFKGRPRWERP